MSPETRGRHRERHVALSEERRTHSTRPLADDQLEVAVDTGDTAWVLTSAALVLLMTPVWRSSTAAWSARRAF